MVDITIFELHVDDISLESPWELAANSDSDAEAVDSGGGLPVARLALAGIATLLFAALGLAVWKRRAGADSDG